MECTTELRRAFERVRHAYTHKLGTREVFDRLRALELEIEAQEQSCEKST